MKYIITMTLNGQELTRSRSAILYTNQQNYVALHFILDPFWEQMTVKGCIFKKDGKSISVLLDEDNDATVPWELLKNPGTLYVSAFGGDRMTTCEADIPVLESGWDENTTNALAPTVDAFNAVVLRLSQTENTLEQVKNTADSAASSLNDKVDKQDGKGLSSNDYTNEDKDFLDTLRNPSIMHISDLSGNSVSVTPDGIAVIDTILPDVFSSSAMGYKIQPTTLLSPAGNTRGATLQIKRRLGGNDQSITSSFLTTGMVEIRTGTTPALDNSAQGVFTSFMSAMSNTPDIIILQARSGQAGVAAPKLVSKSASGFYATLGGSTGSGTTCDYIAIKLNYVANMF